MWIYMQKISWIKAAPRVIYNRLLVFQAGGIDYKEVKV